ncbi:MAG: hypothetical protein KGZ58_09250 [Ignavibacteriales bacterium]|nr:hypothetical protein [Ignavibacteriales bacterium]
MKTFSLFLTLFLTFSLSFIAAPLQAMQQIDSDEVSLNISAEVPHLFSAFYSSNY